MLPTRRRQSRLNVERLLCNFSINHPLSRKRLDVLFASKKATSTSSLFFPLHEQQTVFKYGIFGKQGCGEKQREGRAVGGERGSLKRGGGRVGGKSKGPFSVISSIAASRVLPGHIGPHVL